MVLHDWQRGRIPYFAPPPQLPEHMRRGIQAKNKLPEDAADAELDAAEAMSQKAKEATMRQVGRRMPAAHGLFDEEDMRGDDDEAHIVEEGDTSGSDGEHDDEEAADDDEGADASDDEQSGEEVSDEEGEDGDDDNHGDESGSEEVPLSDDENGGLDEAALAKFASDDEDEEEPEEEDSGDESDGYGEEGLSWDAVLADVRGEKSAKDAQLNVPAGGSKVRVRKGGGGGVFHRDAMKAKNKNKVPRGTVSFMKEEGKTGRDRSKGAARTRIAERKAKRRVEV
jgi:nuclear GTP-binding protein